MRSTSPISNEKAGKLIEELRKLQKTQTPGNRAKINDLMSRFRSTRGNTGDAQDSAEPGEDVGSGGAAPSRSSSVIEGGKIDAGSAKRATPSRK